MSDPQTLLRESYGLEYGPEKVALLLETVRQADLLNDEKMGYNIRKSLVEAATFSGQGDQALPAFAWCLNYLDNHLEELGSYEAHSLAWRHKWMLNAAVDLPQIPWTRLEELHADFERRARALGVRGGTVASYQLSLAMHRGDVETAQAAFKAWRSAGRDRLSDCSACESQQVADYYDFMGDDLACLRQSAKMIERGESCAHIPHSTYARALEPLMRQGEWETAEGYAQKGRRMVSGKPDFLSQQADFLIHLALTNTPAALKWYARHLPWAEKSNELGNVASFHNAAALLFSVLDGGRKLRKLSLPSTVRGYQPDGMYSVSERLDYHLEEARRIAALFDTRNGTDAHAEELAGVLKLAELRP